MLKRMCKLVVFSSMFILSSIGMAHSPLEKNVVDILKSDSFLIQYELINVNTDAHEAAQQYYKENSNIVTVAKLGKDKLTVTDSYKKGKLVQSIGFLSQNGVDYAISAMGKRCYSDVGLTNFKNASVVPSNSVTQVFDANLFSFKYHFLPFIPEENKAVGVLDGRESTMNICNVYQKDGKVTVAGKVLDYVDYKTADDMQIVSKGRYYFDNGNLVNYVRIDKDSVVEIEPEMQALVGTDKVNFGGYAKVKVLAFFKDVNPNLFILPKGVKVYKPKGVDNISNQDFY